MPVWGSLRHGRDPQYGAYGPYVCYQCLTPLDCQNGEGCNSRTQTCSTCTGPNAVSTARGAIEVLAGPYDCPPGSICSNYWNLNGAGSGVCLPNCDAQSCPADRPICAVLPALDPSDKYCFGCLQELRLRRVRRRRLVRHLGRAQLHLPRASGALSWAQKKAAAGSRLRIPPPRRSVTLADGRVLAITCPLTYQRSVSWLRPTAGSGGAVLAAAVPADAESGAASCTETTYFIVPALMGAFSLAHRPAQFPRRLAPSQP